CRQRHRTVDGEPHRVRGRDDPFTNRPRRVDPGIDAAPLRGTPSSDLLVAHPAISIDVFAYATFAWRQHRWQPTGTPALRRTSRALPTVSNRGRAENESTPDLDDSSSELDDPAYSQLADRLPGNSILGRRQLAICKSARQRSVPVPWLSFLRQVPYLT